MLGFAYYIIFIAVNDKEIFDLRVLGFAYYIILISINGEEDLEMEVLGRGPRRANRYFI